MYPRQTIAAIATPLGAGGIAVVRVSGDGVRALASRVFHGFPAEGPESHRLYLGRFVASDGTPIDRGLAVLMAAPRSYTGEDVLELHCHGGPVVARSVLTAALAAGARSARPGEFTLRAFFNGKVDLAQAEAIADLIGARTEGAARLAGAQLDGELSREIEEHRRELIAVAARLEAAIDFVEEEGVELDGEEIARTLCAQGEQLRRLAGTFRGGRLLREGARVVFTGCPNVGKSSLINRLLGTERVIVTPMPGTTRDTIEETTDIAGVPVVLIDSAGLRESDEPAERFGIERALAEVARADLVVWVVDASVDWQGPPAYLLDALQQKPLVLALNKSDLECRFTSLQARPMFPEAAVVTSSAIASAGIEALRSTIAELIQGSLPSASGPIITRERHRGALERAAARLDLALEAIAKRHPAEIIAVDVIGALDELGEIVGISTPEEILDRVFSEFCIGK